MFVFIYYLTTARSYLLKDGISTSHRNDGTYLSSGMHDVMAQKVTTSTLIHHTETFKFYKRMLFVSFVSNVLL